MARPRLDDDGQSVTLDLHGASVAEGVSLAQALVVEAARRGRSTVRLLYGSSTYDAGVERTIKGALIEALSDGDFDRHVASTFQTDESMTLGLAPAPSPKGGRLSLGDLR